MQMCLGGKGANLAALVRAGFPVPEFVVVPTEVFDRFTRRLDLDTRQLIDSLATAPESEARSRSAEVIDAIARAPLPGDVVAEIEARCAALAAAEHVAVRSSVVGEDSGGASFAGQMRTYLHVTRDQIVDRVRGCWSSAFAEGAMLYRKLRAIGGPVRVAVVIQRMIAARVSGVLFTRDPRTGDARSVVAAAPGLGEGVVGGIVDCDTYVVDRDGQLIESEVADKRTMVALDRRGHGTTEVEVPASWRRRPALSADQLAALADYGARAEATFGGPQDVEFAIDSAGEIHILQSRPITSEPLEVFDNANIVESYPGISSPLTFSFAREHYETVFREAVRLFGLPETTVEANRELFANLVASISGRVYYNIGNWYRLFELGGLERALPAWEEALGLQSSDRGGGRASLATRLRVLGSIAGRVVALQRRIERFDAVMSRAELDFAATDLGELDDAGLFALEARLRDQLVAPYAVSIVNDFAAQQVFAAVGHLIDRWHLGDREAVRNALMIGVDIASAGPARSLFAIAGQIRGTAGLAALFESGASDAELWDALRSDPEIAAAIDEHIARYGDRAVGELKLETETLRERPEALVGSLRNAVRRGVIDESGGGRELRAATERWINLRLGPVRRRAFWSLVGHCQRLVGNRESLRLARTRAFGMFRSIYRELGRRLADRGALADPGDVFWLTCAELRDLPADHAERIAGRRRDWEADADRALPPRIRCASAGRAMFRYTGPDHESGATAAADGSALRGVPCGPGVVTAPARVLEHPTPGESIDGEVLVAPMTDPGWVYLMVASSGLVVEKGSVLSHTAIIGRELGIPTVVGVADATRRIRDGAVITVDGGRGTVSLSDAS